jgi:cell division protein FtsL
VVISFHSLEDRMAKRSFRAQGSRDVEPAEPAHFDQTRGHRQRRRARAQPALAFGQAARGGKAARMTSPVAETKAVVDSGGARRRLSFGLIGLIVLGVTLVATAHVAVHAKRIEVAIALGKEERAFRELTLQRRHLEIEIGMLKDPARIIAIARDQLGMRPPAPVDIRVGGNP